MIGGKIDSKTVGFFFSKSVKKSVKCGERVLRGNKKKNDSLFSIQ